MPKIIQNVREQLLAETKRQIAENGYGKTTVRSVASACGLGVGTVYNYFRSKDVLIASFVLEDWKTCLESMKRGSTDDAELFLRGVYTALGDFTTAHSTLFRDSDAAKVFASVFAERHKQLREQLAEVILPLCEVTDHENKPFLAECIAETLLTWTMAGKSFPDIYSVLRLLVK